MVAKSTLQKANSISNVSPTFSLFQLKKLKVNVDKYAHFNSTSLWMWTGCVKPKSAQKHQLMLTTFPRLSEHKQGLFQVPSTSGGEASSNFSFSSQKHHPTLSERRKTRNHSSRTRRYSHRQHICTAQREPSLNTLKANEPSFVDCSWLASRLTGSAHQLRL